MKFAITIRALMPVDQFVVIEAPTKEEALEVLKSSIRDDLSDSVQILSVEQISEEEFEDILVENTLEKLEEKPQRSLN